MIEASTHAYDARDDAQAKLLSLKEKADKELAQYSTELKVLLDCFKRGVDCGR